jgi:hypothetical protein
MYKRCNASNAKARKANLAIAKPYTLRDACITEKRAIAIDVKRKKEQETVLLDELFLHDVKDNHPTTDPNDTVGLRWWEEYLTETRRSSSSLRNRCCETYTGHQEVHQGTPDNP